MPYSGTKSGLYIQSCYDFILDNLLNINTYYYLNCTIANPVTPTGENQGVKSLT
nr:MAG TPA: hypothetical protein [Caudoviricetes sp.]